jgi:Gas vesicle synthesis protein GvpL/GvpF
VIWLYAICDRPELPPPAPLEALEEAGLQAVFSRDDPGDPVPDALWAHERAVEQLMADRTVLPVRFASGVADEAALRRLLAENRVRYAAALARLAGRIELGVRALATTPRPRAASGREHVLAKLGAARLHEPLAALAVESCRRPAREPDELLRGAYLVDRGAVAGFQAQVERLQAAHPDTALLCTGPWPPYSFAA